MIINQNCCIKLVPLVIFIYDAWSHIHHTCYTLQLTGKVIIFDATKNVSL